MRILVGTLAAVTSLTACGAGDIPMSDTGFATGTDTGELSTEWAEIRCVEWNDDKDICLGLPTGSDDAWVYVLGVCELDFMVASGEYIRLQAWRQDSCASGVLPSTMFTDDRCYWSVSQEISICYSGDGEWFSAVIPDCHPMLEELDLSESAWPSWECNGKATPGISSKPWESMACGPTSATPCIGWIGNSAHLIQPTCWMDDYTKTMVPTC